MKLNINPFIFYKLFNSCFTGLSIGILFTIYEPIKPSIFSIGGIFLALGLLIIANYYEKLLNISKFFYISIFVELFKLLSLILFFLLKYSIVSALLIYVIYQITFIFGGYLVRAETLVVKEKKLLSRIDINKQVGYLIGLCLSLIFYKTMDLFFEITDKKVQITILHYLLLTLQIFVIYLLIKSFKK